MAPWAVKGDPASAFTESQGDAGGDMPGTQGPVSLAIWVKKSV